MSDELDIPREEAYNDDNKFVDIGRLKLNRKKQQVGIESLTNLLHNGSDSIKPIFAGGAISGLFAIFYDGVDFFRIKNIIDSKEAHELLESVGLEVYDSVTSIKQGSKKLSCQI